MRNEKKSPLLPSACIRGDTVMLSAIERGRICRGLWAWRKACSAEEHDMTASRALSVLDRITRGLTPVEQEAFYKSGRRSIVRRLLA